MSNQTPYIGSKISLISKLDIRYEGVLYSVNTTDSTIALVKVRSLGTEDRQVANPVAARDDVYEHIIFKASDIKDLIVCETPKAQTLGGLPYDPAIVSVSNRPEPSVQSASSSRPNTPGRSSPPAPIRAAAPGPRPGAPRGAPNAIGNLNRGGYQQRQGGYNNGQQGGYQNRGYNNGPQPLMGRGGRGGYNNRFSSQPQQPREKLRFDNDYDFEKANEQFQEALSDLLKEKLTVTEKEGESEVEKPVPEDVEGDETDDDFYNKGSSFFDRISCEALEKRDGKKGRPDWRKERETNQETFGHSAVRSLNYRRGFGRGRGGNMGGGGYRNYNNGGGYNNGGSYQGGNRGYGGGRGGFRRNNQQQEA